MSIRRQAKKSPARCSRDRASSAKPPHTTAFPPLASVGLRKPPHRLDFQKKESRLWAGKGGRVTASCEAPHNSSKSLRMRAVRNRRSCLMICDNCKCDVIRRGYHGVLCEDRTRLILCSQCWCEWLYCEKLLADSNYGASIFPPDGVSVMALASEHGGVAKACRERDQKSLISKRILLH